MTPDVRPPQKAVLAVLLAPDGGPVPCWQPRHCLRCARGDAREWAFWELGADRNPRAWQPHTTPGGRPGQAGRRLGVMD